MKKMRRLAGLLLAMVMVMSMAVSTFAATVSVTVDESTLLAGHTFEAYQIFSGTQSEEDILGDVAWGTGINSDKFLAALKADDTVKADFASCATAADVATVLGTYNDKSEEANAVARIAYANKLDVKTSITTATTELATGYYLIVDTTNIGSDADAVNNAALLQVTNSINIALKTDKPSVEKKVYENDKYDGVEYGKGYNDVADHEIGEDIPFKLIANVPDMTYYDTYKFVFHDTLSDGLTLNDVNGSSIKVYVADDKAGATNKTEISGWNKNVDGQNFTISFADLKKVANVRAGKYIIVEYTAKLNANAEIGLAGNENKVYLEYSNNPDHSGEGDTEPETGRTPDDKVIVFTYELDATKVDGNDTTKVLKDAEFVLYRDEDGRFAKLDANGKVESWVEDEKQATTIKSQADGTFKVIGLDDGIYWLKETKAPAGYNLLTAPIKLEIVATTANNQSWQGKADDALTALKLDVTANNTTTSSNGDLTTGIVSTQVLNNKGTTLPETGGMGTTLFYVIGATLAIGAAVVMVTRKRMSAN